MEDEDHTLSADSDCISDCSENSTEYVEKIVSISQINALNGRNTKFCIIYCYNTTGGALTVCSSYMIALQGVDSQHMYALRKHKIEILDEMDGRFCSNCRDSLYLIFPCNMCPICTQWKKNIE